MNRWTALALVNAVTVALSLGYFIAGNPIQINDGIANLFRFPGTRLADTLVNQFAQPAYLRPLLWAQLDISFDVAEALGGRIHEVYKAIHVAQVVATGVLFVGLLRVRTSTGAVAAMAGVAMLIGGHTFAGTVYEGYPINTFLTIIICCLLAAWLAFGEPAWWRSLGAALLLVFAALTVETGLLVWVVIAAAWLAGERGMSLRGVGVLTGLLAGYFVLRFVLLDVGAPALVERSAGFGFRVVEREELAAMFEGRAAMFYAYNVASQLLTVLVGEPRNGVYAFSRDLLAGEVLPRQWFGVLATTGASVIIAGYVARRASAFRRWRLERGDRLVVVCAAVTAASAVISYPYSKDVVMSVAGAFHALAAAVALAPMLEWLGAPGRRKAAALPMAAALVALTLIWTVKLVGIHYALRSHAFIVRNDWAEALTVRRHAAIDTNPAAERIVRRLQQQVIAARTPAPHFSQPFVERFVDMPW
jgi:hypothetical protein